MPRAMESVENIMSRQEEENSSIVSCRFRSGMCEEMMAVEMERSSNVKFLISKCRRSAWDMDWVKQRMDL